MTGTYYIGSTHHLNKRLLAHAAALRRNAHENPRLQRAWNKYGPAAFVFSHHASPLSAADLGALEQTLIDEGLDLKCVFNMNRNVERPRLGAVLSSESRQKIAAAKRGTRLSEQARAARQARLRGAPNAMQGKRHSEETRALISRRLKEGYAAGRAPTKVHPTETQRQAMSARHTGNTWRLNKGSPLGGVKDQEFRVWPTTIACAKDIGCDLSYPSQRAGTGKTVKGWVLEYTHKNASADEIEEKIRARLKKYLPPVLEIETVQDVAGKLESPAADA